MHCGFCGYDFEEKEGIKGCKNCPMTAGCKMIKCPKCNYENPPEPFWVKKIKKILNKRVQTL
jgi:hypothetical protein